MRNPERDRSQSPSDGEAVLHRYVWGHPVRHLELHAWHWLRKAAEANPRHGARLQALMRRLEEATAPLTVPDSAAVGWVGAPKVDREMVGTLEKIVAVMRDLERLLSATERGS